MSAFHTVPAVTPRRMLRHTTHLATALRPAHRRKKARTDDAVVAQMHTDAVTYPARRPPSSVLRTTTAVVDPGVTTRMNVNVRNAK